MQWARVESSWHAFNLTWQRYMSRFLADHLSRLQLHWMSLYKAQGQQGVKQLVQLVPRNALSPSLPLSLALSAYHMVIATLCCRQDLASLNRIQQLGEKVKVDMAGSQPVSLQGNAGPAALPQPPVRAAAEPSPATTTPTLPAPGLQEQSPGVEVVALEPLESQTPPAVAAPGSVDTHLDAQSSHIITCSPLAEAARAPPCADQPVSNSISNAVPASVCTDSKPPKDEAVAAADFEPAWLADLPPAFIPISERVKRNRASAPKRPPAPAAPALPPRKPRQQGSSTKRRRSATPASSSSRPVSSKATKAEAPAEQKSVKKAVAADKGKKADTQGFGCARERGYVEPCREGAAAAEPGSPHKRAKVATASVAADTVSSRWAGHAACALPYLVLNRHDTVVPMHGRACR